MHRSISTSHPLVLGSASPRRAAILRQLNVPIAVHGGRADETRGPRETLEDYLDRVTLLKLSNVRATLPPPLRAEGAAILVADTSVVHGNDGIGKPRDQADARRMIALLSGGTHQVWTRFAIASCGIESLLLHRQTVRTSVKFRAIDDDEQAAYVATGEGLDKAGGYAIQGVAAAFVEQICGSYTNVVGLPACEVVVALRASHLL